ncbi:MAG: DUF1501 domain-containing protein [Planctomycetota bacterium]|nr:DUF1501 domain-containing protein [Planctomycetota bacterium]
MARRHRRRWIICGRDRRFQSFELTFRIQAAAPGVTDLTRETKETLKLYGVDERPTDEYGRICLMARRMS